MIETKLSRLDPSSVVQLTPDISPNQRAPRRGAPEVCDALFRDSSTPALGPPSSSVQIAAFLDYRCPYCRVLSGILANLHDHGDIRVLYHEWPSLGEASELAARAALAAARQGAYAAFHRRLMSSRFIPTMPLIEAIATELGLDRPQLLKDMASDEVAAAIRHTTSLASELGLAGTPVMVIGRTVVEGQISRGLLDRLIQQMVAQGSARAC